MSTAKKTWGRRKPYTAEGIKRVPCIRCGKPSLHQFQICALGRVWTPLCLGCDVTLNLIVCIFMLGAKGRKPGLDYAKKAGIK
jgi:hypothetical protein